METEGSVTLITGGTAGIGLALARRLNAKGGKVAVTSNDAGSLAAVADFALGIEADVASPDDNKRVIDQVLREFEGRLDAWVNNAGIARHSPIPDYTEAEIDAMLAVNIKGTILGSQTALRHFSAQKAGHIINVISTASLRGIPTESVYCASKWAVRGFTQALAEEAAPDGVRVTGVLPGGVDTAFWDAAVDRQMPVEDFLQPEHIADGIISVLEMDDTCVTREIVLRAIKDRDFAQ